MKPVFVSVAAFLSIISFAVANAEDFPANYTEESSISPDSIFWGIYNDAFVIIAKSAANETNKNNNETKDIYFVCTQEARICPDGTIIERTGPKCKFQHCPTSTAPKN